MGDTSGTTPGHQYVCVTGASGFIASHITLQLLQRGYHVRATVRSIKAKDKVEYLLNLDKEFPGHLKLCEADLEQPESFDAAIKGCEFVIHTATPTILVAKKDPQKEIVDPAVKGTISILNACRRAKTVKKVVLTSSAEAVWGHQNQPPALTTEEHWNTQANVKDCPYPYAKVLAEKAAWEFVEKLPKEEKFTLVTICPPGVFGPQLNNILAISNGGILSLLGQYPFVPNFNTGYADVRDVAKAHILAIEINGANGRYLISNGITTFKEMTLILKKNFPQFPVARLFVPKYVMYFMTLFDKRISIADVKGFTDYPQTYTSDKAIRELNFKFDFTLEQTLVDTIHSFQEKKLIRHLYAKYYIWGAAVSLAVLLLIVLNKYVLC